MKLLNEQTVEVDADVLRITDDSGPIGLAGIMGGDSTKADLDTRNVFLESAFFFPDAIAGRARRYNFTSDASHRFERGVDFDNNVRASSARPQLILEICGGEPGPDRRRPSRSCPQRKPVRMRVARAQQDHRHRRAAPTRSPTSSRGSALRPRGQGGRGRSVRRHAAVVSLRHRDRGRPDRGGRARPRLRAHPGASAASRRR